MTDVLDLTRGFICGAFSGWSQVWVMQPFEMVKLRLINQCSFNPEYLGMVDCVRKIIKHEGASAFYKGTASPLIGYSLQGCLTFGSNEVFKRLIGWLDKGSQETGAIMPLWHVLLSGTLTGVVSSIVLVI